MQIVGGGNSSFVQLAALSTFFFFDKNAYRKNRVDPGTPPLTPQLYELKSIKPVVNILTQNPTKLQPFQKLT